MEILRKEFSIMDDKTVVHENSYTIERDNLINDFSLIENEALNRLAEKMEENNNAVISDYSRTHHRHNRSHTRR